MAVREYLLLPRVFACAYKVLPSSFHLGPYAFRIINKLLESNRNYF
jgi:hypothetical protein